MHAAVFERPALDEFEVDLLVHRMKQWNAAAEKYGMNAEPDLVDHAGIEQRSGKIASAHDTNSLPLLTFKFTHEFTWIRVQYSSAFFLTSRQCSRKDVGFHTPIRVCRFLIFRFWGACNHEVPGFSAHYHCVDARPIVLHNFPCFITPQYPIDRAVRPCNVVIEAVSPAKCYFSCHVRSLERFVQVVELSETCFRILFEDNILSV